MDRLGTDGGRGRLGGLSGTPRHRILTGRIRARTRNRQTNCFSAKTAKRDADITPASPVGTRTAERISATGVRGKNSTPADTPPHFSPSTPRRPSPVACQAPAPRAAGLPTSKVYATLPTDLWDRTAVNQIIFWWERRNYAGIAGS